MKPAAILLSIIASLPALATWQDHIPADIAREYLESDQVFTEAPCDWRKTIGAIIQPLVKDCTSPRDAALAISSHISQATGVYYSQERRKPDMNALEALAEKKVSCTGQSILLVCALRSAGLPARLVGVPTWNHVQGNHSWAEVWFEGEWHMLEFNEKDFNTPWVMESIGMLDASQPWQRIRAVSKKGGSTMPAWKEQPPIPAEDVTDRYLSLAAEWYAANGLTPDKQLLMVELLPRKGKVHSSAARLLDESGRLLEEKRLPSTEDDMRQFATFSLPRSGDFYLQLPDRDKPLQIHATSGPAQVLRIDRVGN